MIENNVFFARMIIFVPASIQNEINMLAQQLLGQNLFDKEMQDKTDNSKKFFTTARPIQTTGIIWQTLNALTSQHQDVIWFRLSNDWCLHATNHPDAHNIIGQRWGTYDRRRRIRGDTSIVYDLMNLEETD